MYAFAVSSSFTSPLATRTAQPCASPLRPQSHRATPPRRHASTPRMIAPVDDKAVVTEYFNNTGFDRWNRIYSDSEDVNDVQQDIRKGHLATINKILSWFDDDGDAPGMKVADAGCGVGSLAIPLAQRGALVSATDISDAMVRETTARAEGELGDKISNLTVNVSDLENISGRYDTVCCIDVLIHYPSEKLPHMIDHLTALSTRRVILTFAPQNPFLAVLKKVGELFPGQSKATRAYLHSEDAIEEALKTCGFRIERRDQSSTKFYYSRILEGVRNTL